ncbi:uncharacterized protein yc1106_00608 [Curvularia clavata]|uniref:Uncharacterized protein n=1 Tax=Curvularia clavata TaxID=95742 RepID=A0A9Q8Z073_CURCL|nr:uncharacterized protein yc1106_00608 [Curvularia clavata]
MAVKLDSAGARATPKAVEAEVSTCVAAIIEAFTNGLNIFKRLRERRKKRRSSSRRDSDTSDASSVAEHQLSKSLRRGPSEVADKYAECYNSGMGPRFAKGDTIAYTALAETLIKLNTGLVAIIASFLNHEHKNGKSQLDLDYKSLTHLSDASRREALVTLSELYQRLSHSQAQLHKMAAPACLRCGSSKHHDCSSRSASPEKERKKRSTSSSTRQRSLGPVVTRRPLKNGSSNHPQLVVVRPKMTRKSASSSNSSSAVKSTSSSSRTTSPTASPQPRKLQMASPELKKLPPAPVLPLYVPVDPLELQSTGVIKGTLGGGAPKTSSRVKQRVDSFQDPREPWPLEHLPHTITKSPSPKPVQVAKPAPPPKPSPTPKHIHEPTPKLPTFFTTPRRSSTPTPSAPPKPPVPSKPEYLSPPPLLDHAPATIHFRRRMEKATPSSYTFASDSTKMGEIPQRKWTSPFDFEKAERLNAEAALNGYPNPLPSADKAEKRKKRFGFMRRGDA